MIDGDRCPYYPDCEVHRGLSDIFRQHDRRLLTRTQVMEIRNSENELSAPEAAVRFGVHTSTIHHVRSRRRYREIP